MHFTKEHGIVRMHVGCANPQNIPKKKEEMVFNELDNNSSLVLHTANKLCDEEEHMVA
jgi:hypothetical protein